LALLEKGTPSAGPLKPVAICRLMSNEKAECGTDLNPTADVELEYIYEFPNGNVVLKGTNRVYFFNGSQVVRPTSYRNLGGTSDISEPGGINLPSSSTYYATPNFLIALSGGQLVVVTREGKVIKDSGVTAVNTSCEAVTKGSDTFKLNVDGTSSNITATIPDQVLAEAGDKFLVKKGSKVYLSSSKCSTSGALEVVDAAANDAKMVKVGDDFYIAARAGTSLYYRKVSGSAVPVSFSIGLYSTGTNKHYYALDGRGRLYAITAANTVSVYNIDGTAAGTANVTGVAGLLGLADRALAGDGSNVHEITTTGSTASAINKGSVLNTVVSNCTDETPPGLTIAIDGAGTNFIRCAHSSGLYSLTFDSGSGLYSQASYAVSISSSNDVKWATGKVLVRSGSDIKLCSTTTTPSISCSPTDLPNLDTTVISGTGAYLKSNGNNVFYVGSGGVLKVGNIFDLPSALPITASSSSGGNASFDLNRFAFSVRPVGAPCAIQILYLPSRTASPKYYTIAQPSNACVTRILKVY
jgi:hypothetical protein